MTWSKFLTYAWFFSSVFSVSVLSPVSAQSCLGLSPRANSTEVAFRVSHQNRGYRMGGRASANVAGVLGIEAGAAGGKIDGSAVNGTEVTGLLWISPFRVSPPTCLFAEYETSEENYEGAFGQDRGNLRERWIRVGVGMEVPLGTVVGSGLSFHLAPEFIGRKSKLKGRTLHVDTTVYVLETKKQNTSTHLGGRLVLSLRRERRGVLLFLRTRPRIGSDLEWGVQVHLPI